MIYPARTPGFIQFLFPGFLWRSDSDARQLYLTFDDGPVPEITPWVLDVLKEYSALATFFCVGENVLRSPEIYRRIRNEGHAVGNHTYNHISGWSHDPAEYMDNVSSCAEVVDSVLFRPPYGRLGRKHARSLRGSNYRIVMWDILSGDFDTDIDPDRCYRNVIDNASPGSIIVFHDSVKAEVNLRSALPKVLSFFADRNYSFLPIRPSVVPQQSMIRRLA